MGRRSTVLNLPRDVRRRLEERLFEMGFQGYAELTEWLAAQGHVVSQSAVNRYGRKFRERLQPEMDRIRIAGEETRVLMEELGEAGEAFVRSDASLALVQERIWSALRRMGPDASLEEVRTGARAVTEVAKAKVSISREKRELLREAAELAAKTGRRLGLSKEGAEAVRREVEDMYNDGPRITGLRAPSNPH